MIPRTMTPQEAASLRLPLSSLARIPELKVYLKFRVDPVLVIIHIQYTHSNFITGFYNETTVM